MPATFLFVAALCISKINILPDNNRLHAQWLALNRAAAHNLSIHFAVPNTDRMHCNKSTHNQTAAGTKIQPTIKIQTKFTYTQQITEQSSHIMTNIHLHTGPSNSISIVLTGVLPRDLEPQVRNSGAATLIYARNKNSHIYWQIYLQ